MSKNKKSIWDLTLRELWEFGEAMLIEKLKEGANDES